MTTISQIITDAYREGNLIAVGATPTTAEQTEALRLLNRLVASYFGSEFGEDLTDLALGKGGVDTGKEFVAFLDDYPDIVVPSNTRLVLNLEAADTVTLPATPMNGERFAVTDASGNLATYNLTVEGNGRMIEGASTLTLSEDGLDRSWFYRADISEWKRLSTLELTDESPFPSEYDDFLIIGLAIRLNPRHGVAVDPQSMMQFGKLKSRFMAMYSQKKEVPVELALQLIGLPFGAYSSTTLFNLGRPRWQHR